MPDENLADYKVERIDCGHLQTIQARRHQNLADYNTRLVPELRAALNDLKCEQCEQEKAELAKQKLVQEMKEKSHKA